MKKIILLIAIALCSTQLTFAGIFALGVKIGYNANKLSTNLDTVKSQFNSGFHIGVWTRIGKRFYVAPELQYTFSGAVFTGSGNLSTSGWEQKITMGSLEIPVLLGFKIIHSDLISWRVELGPEASFLLNSKIKDVNSITGPITTADLSKANWYIIGGTGIDILFLKFDVRYTYGLNQLIKDAGSWHFDTRNSMWVVSLGFKIFGSK